MDIRKSKIVCTIGHAEILTALERLNELKIPERYGFFRFFE